MSKSRRAQEMSSELRIATIEAEERSRIATAEAAKKAFGCQTKRLEFELAQANTAICKIVPTNKARSQSCQLS